MYTDTKDVFIALFRSIGLQLQKSKSDEISQTREAQKHIFASV